MAITTAKRSGGLESPFAGIHATPAAPMPFGAGQGIRAFLLERDHGNVLVYSAGGVPAAEIRTLGGVGWQYLGHWHEAMFGLDELQSEFGAPVVVHAGDYVEVARRSASEPVTFTGRHALGDGFDLIPIPGHTPGASAFLYEHAGRRFLFTGDTILLDGDEWVAAVLDSSDREAYMESLLALRELEFDVLVPWVATAGRPWFATTGPADARRRIDAILDRLWKGGRS